MGASKVAASKHKPGWAASLWKFGVGTVSAAAAVVSILSNTSSIKTFFDSPKKSLMGVGPEARWAGITPSSDTATSLGDSIHLAVTVTDARGATLNAITPVWTSSDDAVGSSGRRRNGRRSRSRRGDYRRDGWQSGRPIEDHRETGPGRHSSER